MPSNAERFDLYPPRHQGTGRAVSIALLVHLALLGALAWGVSWKRETAVVTMEAQLWSELPQQAAAKLQEVAQTPPAPAPIEPEPSKPPEIALEKIKPTPTPKTQAQVQAPPNPPIKPVPAVQDSKALARAELERQKNLERMAGLAGSSGAPSSPGSALQAGGPSNAYAGIIKGRVRPNLVFAGVVSGNPLVSVQVRLAPDGTVLGRPRVLKSSGNKEWDEAVVRAFEKTEVLPRDGGKIWSPLVIDWRVND